MTTSSADPEPPTDVLDPSSAPGAPSQHGGQAGDQDGTSDQRDQGDESDDTDAMGIDDEDPIDATLVGSPVEGQEGEGASPPPGSGSDTERPAGSE